MAERYYFLHIPKTAGTSIANWLQLSGRFSLCPDGLWSILLQRPREQLDQYSMFCGHFYCYLDRYAGCSLRTFTFLRNPIDRTISHFEHIRRDPHHYFHERVLEQGSLLAFLNDPVTQPLVRNFQTRSLSAIFDPLGVSKTTVMAKGDRLPLERYLETSTVELTDSQSLQLAREFLMRCIFVGITERMRDSANGIAEALGISNDLGVGRLNVDPARASSNSIDQIERATITDLVETDLELYEFGLNLLNTRVRSQ